MRRLVALIVVAVGALAFVLGVAAAIVFGPDDKLTSGPHALHSKGFAVVTGPAAIRYYGLTVQVDVHATRSRGRVFVGIGRSVDVADYLRRSTYTRIDSVGLPWKVGTSVVRGSRSPEAPPTNLDVWLDSQSGHRTASITSTLPDAPVAIVVMNADGSRGVHVTTDLSVAERGMFVGGLAVAVAGAGVGALGWVLRRPRTRTVTADDTTGYGPGSPPDLPSYGPRPTPSEGTDR
jgi:hypothetical protein